jgi:hypothetical protein
MFDAVGAPWPKHDCFNQQYRALKARVLPILKKGADPRSAMSQPFAELGEMFGIEVADGLGDIAQPAPHRPKTPKQPAPAKQSHSIKRMEPVAAGEEVSVIGIIRERGAQTACMKALYAALGALGRKLFRLPASGRAIQLTIVDVEGEPNESYSCIADAGIVDRSLTKDVMVWVRLIGNVAPSASAWVVKEIHAV